MRTITYQQTQDIFDYLTNENISQRLRSKPWQDIFEAATKQSLPETLHTADKSYQAVKSQTIQLWCKRDYKLGSFRLEEEKELTKNQATRRKDWINKQLPLQPHSVN